MFNPFRRTDPLSFRSGAHETTMLYRFTAFEFVEIGSADYQILGEIIDSNIPLFVQQELTMATFGSFRSKLVDWH